MTTYRLRHGTDRQWVGRDGKPTEIEADAATFDSATAANIHLMEHGPFHDSAWDWEPCEEPDTERPSTPPERNPR